MNLVNIFGAYTVICFAFVIGYDLFGFQNSDLVYGAITIAWLLGLFVIVPIFLLLNNPYKNGVSHAKVAVEDAE